MHGGFPATPPGAPACRPACPVTAPVAAGGGLHLVYVPPSPRGCSFLLAPLPPHLLVWAHWPPLTLLPGPGPRNCHVGFRGCLGFPTVTSLSLPHGPREPRAMVPALPGFSGSPWACPCASWASVFLSGEWGRTMDLVADWVGGQARDGSLGGEASAGGPGCCLQPCVCSVSPGSRLPSPGARDLGRRSPGDLASLCVLWCSWAWGGRGDIYCPRGSCCWGGREGGSQTGLS